jgi:hypothetical protein
VSDLRPLIAEELTKAEIEGRRQVFVFEKFFQQEVPGYEASNIVGLSHQIGVRETRRVYGEYRLTREDCMEAKIPADTILVCGAPIEDHRKGKDGGDETYWAYISRAWCIWRAVRNYCSQRKYNGMGSRPLFFCHA